MKLLQFSKDCSISATLALGDVGRAAHYSAPYTPTACHGNDPSQFPSDFLFAAAGEGIWDNGAACRRRYLVHKCNRVWNLQTRPDNPSYDRPLSIECCFSPSNDATVVLSTTAFESIAKTAARVNIEYVQ